MESRENEAITAQTPGIQQLFCKWQSLLGIFFNQGLERHLQLHLNRAAANSKMKLQCFPRASGCLGPSLEL